MEECLKKILIIVLVFIISGCSSKLAVTPVSNSEIKPYMEKKGLFFSLPKTAVDIEIYFKATDYVIGKYHDIFEECLQACRNNEVTPDKCAEPQKVENTEIILKEISINSSIIPDENHRYNLNIDRDTFSEISHTMSLSSDGILIGTDNTVTNKTVEFGIELLRFAGAIAAPVFFSRIDIPETISEFEENCQELKQINSILDKHKTWYGANGGTLEKLLIDKIIR